MWCCRRFLRPSFLICGLTDCGCVQLVGRGCNVHRRCLRQYSTQKPPLNLWSRDQGLPLLLMAGVGAAGFFWYMKKKSEEEDDVTKTIVAVKRKFLLAQGRHSYQHAEDDYHKALKLLADSTVADEQVVLEAKAVTLDKLANLYLEQKKWIEAENTFREAMRVMLRAGAAQDSDAFIEISLKLARIYHNQKRVQVAEAGFDWCVATSREKCAQENSNERSAMLAMSLQCRATFYSYVNRHSEAIADFMELVKLAKDMHGKDSLEVAVANSNLSVAVDGSGNTERALSLIQSSMGVVNGLMEDSAESVVKEELKTNLATFYINLAKIQSNSGNHSLALEAYGKADKMLEGLRDEELSMVISEGRKFSNSKLSAG